MASCDFCKNYPKEQLKSCVCGKVSYCSKECQIKDWKTHKPSCPPYVIKESPGKGRGLFATRKIKEGQIILEEYPLFTVPGKIGIKLYEFLAIHVPNMDDDTKAKILHLNDPAENIKKLDTDTVEKLLSKNLLMMFYKEAETDEISKIFRIFTGNRVKICWEEELYSDTTETGLYHKISLINHGCVPTAASSWVMGDFQRHQVRAIMTIEKDEEILLSYWNTKEFIYGSREFSRQELLEDTAFLCECSECSLEGEDLEENERMRAEIREKRAEIRQTLQMVTSASERSYRRKSMKKVMKLCQQRVKLLQKLDFRSGFVSAMIEFYVFAVYARRLDISSLLNPEIYKQEALKYAKMFGDIYIHSYNSKFNEMNLLLTLSPNNTYFL